MDATKIVGANPANGRAASDFYPTPSDVTEALLRGWPLMQYVKGKTVWECAAGQGHIANVLEDHGFNVVSGDIMTGQDFLLETERRGEIIITNPPFSLSEQFIRKAASFDVPFAFLLKSQYWHSARRLTLFREIQPKYVMPLAWRPDFTGEITGKKGSPVMDVIWCCWEGNSTATYYVPIGRSTSDGH